MTRRAVVAAFRGLRHAPRLAIAAVLCAAIGVAATTAVSAFLSAVLLRDVPFPHPDRLVRVWLANDRTGEPRGDLSIPELVDFEQRATGSLDAFLGTARSRLVALLPQGAERLRGEGVTRAYFDALALRPSLGRLFTAGDFDAGALPAIVISADTWRRHFGANPAVVGTPLRTAAVTFTIVGVAPEGFAGTIEADIVEYWVPLPQYVPAYARTDRTVRASWAIGRLREGTTMAQAQQELTSLVSGFATANPAMYRDLRPFLEPMGEISRREFRGAGLVLLGVSVALLLIAALNVAGLLTARALDRRRELAIVAAMGASRGELIAQLAGEALLLALVGGGLGAVLAQPTLTALLSLSPIDLPSYVTVAFDVRTLVAAVGGVILAGVIAGIAPALLAGKIEPADVLRGASRGAMQSKREQRWAPTLVAIEVALALSLVVGGALLLTSYRNMATFDPGYRVDGFARLGITVSTLDVADAALPAFFDRVRDTLLAEPGVDGVGLVAPTLPPWDGDRRRVRFAKLADDIAANGLEVGFHLIGPGLLPALEMPLVAGRGIELTDGPASEPVAVISRTLADRMGGPQLAIGQPLRTVGDPAMMMSGAVDTYRVVGVVADVAYDGIGAQNTGRYIQYGSAADPLSQRDDVYVALARQPSRVVSIGITTRGEAAALIDPLRRRLARIAPASAVHWTGTMAGEFASEFAASRFYAVLVGVFSSASLTLTAIGLFAMLSHAVTRRRAEIGLRRALGGSRRHIVGRVLRLAAVPLAVGATAGLAGAILVTRAASNLLYGVSPFDLRVFMASLGVLAAAAVLAAVVPAHRASTIDPMTALKGD